MSGGGRGAAGSDRWGWRQTAYEVSQKRCCYGSEGSGGVDKWEGGKAFRKREQHGQWRYGRKLLGMVRSVCLGNGRGPEWKKIELESQPGPDSKADKRAGISSC